MIGVDGKCEFAQILDLLYGNARLERAEVVKQKSDAAVVQPLEVILVTGDVQVYCLLQVQSLVGSAIHPLQHQLESLWSHISQHSTLCNACSNMR